MPWITELKHKRPDGSVVKKYRVGAYKNGRRRFKTFTNRKDAEKWMKTLGDVLRGKDYNLPRRGEGGKLVPTFKEAAEKWFATRETNCKPSTIENYRYLLDTHVLPVFGETRLDEITREKVEAFVEGKNKTGMSARSIRLMLSTMRPVFKRAHREGIVADNPASDPSELIKVGEKKKVAVFTAEEVQDVLDAAIEHLPRFHPLLLTAFRTGMRQGELIALKWGDIDWRGKFIEVGRSYRKGLFSTTKSGKIRRVDMSDQLASVLDEHRKQIAAEVLKHGGPMPELVFPSTSFTPMGASGVRRDFNFVLKKVGIRRIRFHDARHTYASLLLGNGESLAYVRDQMGHSSIQVTVDVYGHLVPGSNRQAVNRLDDPEWQKDEPEKRARIGNRLTTDENEGARLYRNPLILLARPEGFEPPAA